jgi:hypothetical protein
MSTHAHHVDPATAVLDQALQFVDRAPSVHSRLAILRQLAEYWHGPIGLDDGIAEKDLNVKSIPFPLHWWYRLAGRREGILSWQNRLLTPDQLEFQAEGPLLFYVENQGVYVWSATLDGDDPPVLGKFNEDHVAWSPEGMTLSEFLIGACLFEAIMHAPFHAALGSADESTFRQLSAELTPLPLVPWRWPSYPSSFFARNGAFMFACRWRKSTAFDIYLGAKTEQALAFSKSVVDENSWDHITC